MYESAACVTSSTCTNRNSPSAAPSAAGAACGALTAATKAAGGVGCVSAPSAAAGARVGACSHWALAVLVAAWVAWGG
jgi:type VI protein secretion system component VasA